MTESELKTKLQRIPGLSRPYRRSSMEADRRDKASENIERLAEKLGANLCGQVPEYGAGALGAAFLAEDLRRRLKASSVESSKPLVRQTDRSFAKWTTRQRRPLALRATEPE